MRHLRIMVDLWILLPLSTNVKNILEAFQDYVARVKDYAEKTNEGAKNEENTVTATYDVVTHKENNYIHIILDLALLLPLSTGALNSVEAAKPRIRNMVKYASQETDVSFPPILRIHSKYHTCKHGPKNEPCDPEEDV